MAKITDIEINTLRRHNQFHEPHEDLVGQTIPEVFSGLVPPEKEALLIPEITPPDPGVPTEPPPQQPPRGPSPGQTPTT